MKWIMLCTYIHCTVVQCTYLIYTDDIAFLYIIQHTVSVRSGTRETYLWFKCGCEMWTYCILCETHALLYIFVVVRFVSKQIVRSTRKWFVRALL